jgi:hypothetical protein
MLATKGDDWPWLMRYNSGHEPMIVSFLFSSFPFFFFPFSLFVFTPYALKLELAAAGGGVGLELSLN